MKRKRLVNAKAVEGIEREREREMRKRGAMMELLTWILIVIRVGFHMDQGAFHIWHELFGGKKNFLGNKCFK